MNDTTSLVGKILDETAKRDAVHFAVAPVIAYSILRPGQDVGFMEQGNDQIVGFSTSDPDWKPIGIVDPFLKHPVSKGQRFFLFLYPQTITSLRHEWTHPAFENAEAVRVMDKVGHGDDAREWLKDYALRVINPYCKTREEAFKMLCEDLAENSLGRYGREERDDNDIDPEMWEKLAIIGVFVDRANLSYHCAC